MNSQPSCVSNQLIEQHSSDRDIIRQRAWVEINHHALANNVQEIKKILTPNTQLMAVVKADAYGHGVVNVVKTLLNNGCEKLAIATLSEGIELRRADIDVPILILGAINTPEEIKAIASWHLEPTICTSEQASIFAETLAKQNQEIPVHLKIDTGMSRLGTRWEEAIDFVKFVQKQPSLKIASVYSHLATADDLDSTMMEEQHKRFKETIEKLKQHNFQAPLLHLANSAGTLRNQSLHYDLVRVGLALYGAYPAQHLKHKVNLSPVMEVKTRVTQIKDIPINTGVSYSHTFKSDRPSTIAIIGIGYADGVPRLLSNRMFVLIKGKLAPQIGNITMDQIIIDITDIPDVKVGDIVTLLGKDGDLEITADYWANALNTISWEIFCGFKHRLPRLTVNY